MSDQRPKRGSMSLQEATVSTLWEITALNARKSADQKGVSEEED
jgi:hypothetical protein